jgi:5-methyltetrahydrofolate--homocysteine methyltransferase
MNALLEKLALKKILVADGATGTELARRGLPPGTAPEKWNLERPDEVRAVAAAYVAAGADIILTNTFGGTRFKLEKSGLEGDLFEINRAGAELAKQAAAGKALVFASIGPSGEFMEPLGPVEEEEMIAAFAEQVAALEKGGVDGFVIESFSDIAEAQAALFAVRENTELPAVVSLTFEKGKKGYATMMGVKPGEAADALEAADADAVGANCGAGMEQIIEVAKLIRSGTSLPLWFKPNAGLPKLVDGKTVFQETPEEFTSRLGELIAAGAAVIGGCCGTTPDHIRLLAQKVREAAGSK